MFRRHIVATAVGAVGAVLVLGHVMLGPDIVPVAVALAGAILVAVAGLYLFVVRGRSEREMDRGSDGAPARGNPPGEN